MAIRNVAARLTAACPWADAATVEATVRTAYAAFREARVRTYVPILVERRTRKLLSPTCTEVEAEAASEQSATVASARDARRAP